MDQGVFAAILMSHFVLRPMLLIVAPAIVLRRALILGSFLCALSWPVLALVDGIGPALVAFVVITALAQVFYCTSYHIFFSTLGDADCRGSQVSAVQALGALAGVFGPALGGVVLTTLGPGQTFGAAFIITVASILPLLGLAEPPVERVRPYRAYVAAKTGVQLYFADGWIRVGLTTAWSLAMFQALGGRYDRFGGTLSVAALAGAAGGMALGRFIDLGRARRVIWINAAILAAGLVLRAVAGWAPPVSWRWRSQPRLSAASISRPGWPRSTTKPGLRLARSVSRLLPKPVGTSAGRLRELSRQRSAGSDSPSQRRSCSRCQWCSYRRCGLTASYRGAPKPPAMPEANASEELMGAVS